MNLRRPLALAVLLALTVAACAGDEAPEADVSPGTEASAGQPSETAAPEAGTTVPPTTGPASPNDIPITTTITTTITLVAYDSFPIADTSLNEALASFTAESGIGVELLTAGDTGTMLAKAALTAGNPEGDVMWGIDNTVLSRALDDGVFEAYPDAPTAELSADLTALVPGGEAVPVDFGDVCVNYDIGAFADRGLAVPDSLTALADPAYADLLVVQNPATSSPGLAFLLASIDEFGVDGWQAYWSQLVDNGVQVVDSWTDAYYGSFSWAGGDRPLVVSYGTSPPAEVIFAVPPRRDAPTGVIESTCFRQVEFAGVLAGTDQSSAARALIDFLVGARFQSELALNLFVYPANTTVALPDEFTEFAVAPTAPRTLDPAFIDANRSSWIDQWTDLVLG